MLNGYLKHMQCCAMRWKAYLHETSWIGFCGRHGHERNFSCRYTVAAKTAFRQTV